jgi:dihydroneopterin aldolase/2-amino-4-hydroxy-6-hydroxymethyldihydropteridine diphosphokinase
VSATDLITITGLVARGHHGVLAHERRDGQDFVVDAEVELDTRAAAATDDLGRSIHYGELATALADAVRAEPVDLLETLAERLARICLADERAVAVRVVVHKPQAPIPETFADVAVTVRRTRAQVYPGARDGVLALGSNLGDRAATLAAAVRELAGVDGLEALAVSPVVETDPVLAPGSPAQPEYLNAVVAVRSTLTPEALLAACLAVERAHGRERRVRWAARTLDVDVVSYGGLVLDTPDLVLPHARAATRAFVLAPWAALDPGAELPLPGGATRRVADLLAGLPPEAVAGVRPRPDIVLAPPAARPAPDRGTPTQPPTRLPTRPPAEEALP